MQPMTRKIAKAISIKLDFSFLSSNLEILTRARYLLPLSVQWISLKFQSYDQKIQAFDKK